MRPGGDPPLSHTVAAVPLTRALARAIINVPAILEGPYDEAILTMAFGRLREAGAEVEVVEDDGR